MHGIRLNKMGGYLDSNKEHTMPHIVVLPIELYLPYSNITNYYLIYKLERKFEFLFLTHEINVLPIELL